MVLGFFRHIFEYFVLSPGKNTNPRPTNHQNQTTHFTIQDLIPIYNQNGQIEGYTRRPTSISQSSNLSDHKQPNPELLYHKTADGQFILLTPPNNVSGNPPQHMPDTKKLHNEPKRWDGWPNGEFHCDFTYEEYKEADSLAIHWAHRTSGGDRKGDCHASSWEKGKRSTKTCLGAIVCDREDCEVILRPVTSREGILKQLQGICPGKNCSSTNLAYQTCGVRAITWRWAEGVHLYNDGIHPHQRPGRKLHLLNDERQRFEKIVKAHPKTGPLGLIVGVPGIEGPGESVADISRVLVNADRVSKERQKIKGNTNTGGDDFIAAYARFDKENPGIIISSTFGEITVISIQTTLMRSNLVKPSKSDEPTNGMVNDAAHGFWKERNSLLMMTSSYSPILSCWVPGLVSYTNGATERHFQHHFFALFQSIAHEAEKRGILVTDLLFAGMMDFSDAERSGFILGFIDFWLMRPDNDRTERELRQAVEALLKGCQEHYRAGVTRISKMAGAIPPEQADAFKARSLGLLDLPSSDEFIHQASLLVRDFPKIKSWMEWWIRPVHAAMLFKSERKMDIEIWESLPDTNNPEEAMNWKFYSGCGRNHALLEGLRGIIGMAGYYQMLFEEISKGNNIRHGQPERWKAVKAVHGRTKLTRAPERAEKKRKKNDGRPPDTKAELLQPAKKTRKKNSGKSDPPKHSNYLIQFGPPSYPWDANSCWLDVSLELLFVSAMRNFEEFTSLFTLVPKGSLFYAFYIALSSRQLINVDEDDSSTTKLLGQQRDKLRSALHNVGVIASKNSFQPLMSWFYASLSIRNTNPAFFQGKAYFYAWYFDFHSCTRSQEIGGHHIELSHIRCLQEIRARVALHRAYGGSISALFNNHYSIERLPTEASDCWRVFEGDKLCPGERSDINDIVISTPVILNIEIDLEKIVTWDFPEVLYPLSEIEANEHGLIYDLVGLALVSPSSQHFIARHASPDHKIIYTYDGLKHHGITTIEFNSSFKTHISGKKIVLPQDYVVHQAVYYLRGGIKAQKAFYELRTQAILEKFQFQISQPHPDRFPVITYLSNGFERLDSSYRGAWSSRDDMDEYISKKNEPISGNRNYDTSEEDIPLASLIFKETPTEMLKQGSNLPEHHLPNELRSNAEDELDLLTIDSTNQSLSSLSSGTMSDFSLACRCGLNGDGNILYKEEDGEAVQCFLCGDWSHVACQRDGRASSLKPKDTFLCEFCDPNERMNLFGLRKGGKVSKRTYEKEVDKHTKFGKPLNERLQVGRGALARRGDFWYPVRVIQHLKISDDDQKPQWRVRWWRGCEFLSSEIAPDSTTLVKAGEIVDSLWKLRDERRKIRLGKWTHSWDIPQPDEIFDDLSLTPYTKEIDNALTPAEDLLTQLLHAPATVKSEQVPAKNWLEQSAKRLDTIVPFSGSLSLTVRAQIMNWFQQRISKDRNIRSPRLWMSGLPISHAYTIYISFLLKDEPKNHGLSNEQLIQKAWEAQTSGIAPKSLNVDVDGECLKALEKEMFEVSERAGIAGNWQWGLDAGDHHYWSPYSGRPADWDHGDREGSESELTRGPNYTELAPQPDVPNLTKTPFRLPKPSRNGKTIDLSTCSRI